MKHSNFASYRSCVYSMHGMVASSQNLANKAGAEILNLGGNAADAAVAVAAVLAVIEPTSTGIGGDCFALYWDEKEKIVKGLNGSGRSPSLLTREFLESKNIDESNPWSPYSPLCVTVPGAVAGWIDTLENFGNRKLTLSEILSPAIKLAREGFPVSPTVALYWKKSEELLRKAPNGSELLLNGHAPREGEIMNNIYLAEVLELICKEGKDGFYSGKVAKKIVEVLRENGGVMEIDDLINHKSTLVTPIKTNYRGIDVYEIPPNGQGLQALLALNLLEGFNVNDGNDWGNTRHIHLLIECMRLAFSDGRHYICDSGTSPVPVGLLSKKYVNERRKLIDPNHSNRDISHGYPDEDSGTVYFNVVDGEGNACSFINSNYMGFGTGIVPKGCGFPLQNRGHGFNLDSNHLNCVAPNKRPYHTIIPGMMVKDGNLLGPFGVMGGFMQPQGHLQVVSNIVDWNMNPQEALNAPRFLILDGTHNGKVAFEEGFDANLIKELSNMGHNCENNFRGKFSHERGHFGTGQIIIRDSKSGVLCGASDPRHDGYPLGL